MKIRDLFVSIGFDVKDQDLKRLDKGLASTKRLALAVGAGVLTLNGLLIGVARQVANVGDKAAKTADKLGANIEALQELRYAAELSGIAQNNFDTGLQRVTRRAAEAAAGTGVAKDALKELGVQVTDASGRMRKSEDLLEAIADGMARIEDPSRRVALAFKLFDTEGVGMVNMLSKGGAALRKMRAEARSLGHIISEADARSAEAFNDELTRARLVLAGLRNAVGARLLPVLTKAMQRFRQWVRINRQVIKSGLEKALRGVLALLQRLAGIGREAVMVLGDIADLFGGVERAAKAAAWAMGLLTGAYVLTAVGNLAMGVATLTSAIRVMGNAALIANLKAAALPALIGALIAALVVVWQDVISFFKGKDSITGLIVEAFERRLPSAFKVAMFFINLWKGQWQLIIEAVKRLIGLFTDLPAAFDAVKRSIGAAADWIMDKLRPMLEMIETAQTFARKKISFLWDAAGDFFNIGPASAPARSVNNVSNRRDIRINAPVTVSVPEGTPSDAVGPAVTRGVSDGIERMLQDTAARLEPREQY